MTPRQPLAQALREAGRELDAMAPPPAVWSGLAATFERQHPAAVPRWRRPLAWSGAAACAVVLLGSALLMLQLPRHGGAVDNAGSFLPLQPTERWGDGPAWLVSAELPGERLAALGLPYDPGRAGEPVRAELLMHASGEVLAVRLVR